MVNRPEQIAVVGAGTMGHSIALNFAWKGFSVNIFGQDEADLDRGKAGIRSKLAVMSDQELIVKSDQSSILERITYTTNVKQAVAGASFIIEAVPEVLELKHQVFRELESCCAGEAVLASNTSGLQPGMIADILQRPERFLVLHFWNPAHLIPLVEVVPAARTSRKTIDACFNLLKLLDKKAILVKKEIPGFISNRLQFALLREAQYLLEQGVASQEDIDAAVTHSIGRRLPVTGPFLSADLGGLDVFDQISAYLFPDLSRAESSSGMMKNLVAAGKLGTKSGEGFYKWIGDNDDIIRKREEMLIRMLKDDRQRER